MSRLGEQYLLAFWLIYRQDAEKSHSMSGWTVDFDVVVALFAQMLRMHL